MKKFFMYLFCACALFITSACKEEAATLDDNKVYLFYQTTCPHCHDAAQYIKTNYPDLKVTGLDIRLPGNMKLFKSALQKYKINGPAGTPLLCFGDNYIMGWGANEQKMFEIYVKPYQE